MPFSSIFKGAKRKKIEYYPKALRYPVYEFTKTNKHKTHSMVETSYHYIKWQTYINPIIISSSTYHNLVEPEI